jgi:hypothetical protein
MSYNHQLQYFRDEIQKSIIKESTVNNIINGNESDGVLRLKNRISFTIELYRPHEENILQKVHIVSVDCESGKLNVVDDDNNPIYIRYSDFLVEYLNCIYEEVVTNKNYRFVPNPTRPFIVSIFSHS